MSDERARVSISGQCLCESVRFEANAPSKWMAHCHCSQCRHAHGAGFVTWIGFEEARCVITDSAQTLCWYDSSALAQRGFCSRCGSMMFFRSGRWPGELHIAAGTLADPPDRSPQSHVYWSEHVEWSGSDLGDGLPRED